MNIANLVTLIDVCMCVCVQKHYLKICELHFEYRCGMEQSHMK